MIDMREESVNAFDPLQVNSQSVLNEINENGLHLKSTMNEEFEREIFDSAQNVEPIACLMNP
jgi:hypothetical protein